MQSRMQIGLRWRIATVSNLNHLRFKPPNYYLSPPSRRGIPLLGHLLLLEALRPRKETSGSPPMENDVRKSARPDGSNRTEAALDFSVQYFTCK